VAERFSVERHVDRLLGEYEAARAVGASRRHARTSDGSS
jgi:hypothetical protein